MFGLIKKFSKAKPVAETEDPRYLEARSMFGLSLHIYDKETDKVLCGYTNPVITEISVTPEYVVKTIPKQHEGFMWCRECGSTFTGVEEEGFAWK